MIRFFIAAVLALVWAAPLAFAQQVADRVWIQIEAQPSLTLAQERVQDYATLVPDVNGFDLGSGWYGIALGPYARDDAAALLQQYVRAGRIPRDSYIAFARSFRRQFWPIGANQLAAAALAVPAVPSVTAPTPAEPVVLRDVDETPREARRSEALLSRADKRALQTALQWAGFYQGAIDGAFGRGTRGSMAAWQGQNGFEETGVLTTR